MRTWIRRRSGAAEGGGLVPAAPQAGPSAAAAADVAGVGRGPDGTKSARDMLRRPPSAAAPPAGIAADLGPCPPAGPEPPLVPPSPAGRRTAGCGWDCDGCGCDCNGCGCGCDCDCDGCDCDCDGCDCEAGPAGGGPAGWPQAKGLGLGAGAAAGAAPAVSRPPWRNSDKPPFLCALTLPLLCAKGAAAPSTAGCAARAGGSKPVVDARATLKPVVDGTAAAPASGAAEGAAWRAPMPAERLEAARAAVRVDSGGALAAGEGGPAAGV